MYATPYYTVSNIKADLGLFAQDKWTMSRLTLNVGVRFDAFNLYFPEQHVGSGVLVPTRNFNFPRSETANGGVVWASAPHRSGTSSITCGV